MILDWQKIMLNLRGAGISNAAVARRVRMDEATAQRLARGEKREPTFSQGIELLDFHHAMCPDKHSLGELRLSKRTALRGWYGESVHCGG